MKKYKSMSSEERTRSIYKLLMTACNPDCECEDCKTVDKHMTSMVPAIDALADMCDKNDPLQWIAFIHSLLAYSIFHLDQWVRSIEDREDEPNNKKEFYAKAMKGMKISLLSQISKTVQDKIMKHAPGIDLKSGGTIGAIPSELAEKIGNKGFGGSLESLFDMEGGGITGLDVKVQHLDPTMPKEAKVAMLAALAKAMGLAGPSPEAESFEDSEGVKKAREHFKDQLGKHFFN